jgi:hypothetical protein
MNAKPERSCGGTKRFAGAPKHRQTIQEPPENFNRSDVYGAKQLRAPSAKRVYEPNKSDWRWTSEMSDFYW